MSTRIDFRPARSSLFLVLAQGSAFALMACTTTHENAPQPFADAQAEIERFDEVNTESVFPKTVDKSKEKFELAGDLYEEALTIDDAALRSEKIQEATRTAEEAHKMSKSANDVAAEIPAWDENILDAQTSQIRSADRGILQSRLASLEEENGLLVSRITSIAEENDAKINSLSEQLANANDFANSPLARVQDLRFNGSVAFFSVNKTNLEEPFQGGLLEIAETVRQSPKLKVHVVGYADPTGNPERNMNLSHSRAESVKKFLTEKGVSEDQIEIQAMGDTETMGNPTTAARLQLERRVDVRVEAIR
jgi:outer membrane protein OmpA-like peptidoglycan-associated protein